MQEFCYKSYLEILANHLKPAMGCTEPIAIAYAAAVARQALGCLPEKAKVLVSGNIIKNAKAVTVPNTNGRKGIDAACAAGLIAGKPEKELEVIAQVTEAQLAQIDEYLARQSISVDIKPDARLFDILIIAEGEGHQASARIADRHTNVVDVEKDGVKLSFKELSGEDAEENKLEEMLTMEGIFDYASNCDIQLAAPILKQQIAFNTAIAREGMTGKWGASVGKILLDACGSDVRTRARAYAAAGSDARMSGCEMPVIINSGSGNQGITVTIPVVAYAREMNASEEQVLRALAFANLTAIHLKTLIGCLSAYCGAISAGCAAAAGIAFLKGGNLHLINHTLVNGLGILSGTVCDGAKPSCAAKIASAVDAGLMGYEMALAGKQFRGGEGIIKKGVENTIVSVGRLGKEGMRQTDEEILRIMIGE